MCSVEGCDFEPVAYVDIRFPGDATLDASIDDGEDRSQPVAKQRLGFCVTHAADIGLTDIITEGVAVRGLSARDFPPSHALAGEFSWRLVSRG